jgi:hypothetical protein
MPKIIALPQHRLPLLSRQRVGEAVAEIQAGGAAFALALASAHRAGNPETSFALGEDGNGVLIKINQSLVAHRLHPFPALLPQRFF